MKTKALEHTATPSSSPPLKWKVSSYSMGRQHRNITFTPMQRCLIVKTRRAYMIQRSCINEDIFKNKHVNKEMYRSLECKYTRIFPIVPVCTYQTSLSYPQFITII